MAAGQRIRELFIEELAEVKGGGDGNPVKDASRQDQLLRQHDGLL